MELTEIITKKEFKDRIHVQSDRKQKKYVLFYDALFNGDGRFLGYKHKLRCYGGTKRGMIEDAYKILILGDLSNLCWYDVWTAENENQAMKPKIHF